MYRINKHKNRKLYDTITNKYTTMKGIIKLLNPPYEKEIQVYNEKGEDITKEVLTSALQEMDIPVEELISILTTYRVKSKSEE